MQKGSEVSLGGGVLTVGARYDAALTGTGIRGGSVERKHSDPESAS